jgi:hypothetical protein
MPVGGAIDPAGIQSIAVPLRRHAVVVPAERTAAAGVIVDAAGEAPDAIRAFLVEHGVIGAAVAADEHAVARDRDTARVVDRRREARGHVVAVHELEQHHLATELHDGHIVLHAQFRACERAFDAHERAAKHPFAVAGIASIEQGSVRVAAVVLVDREHEDVAAVDGDARAEVFVSRAGRFRQRLGGLEKSDFSASWRLESAEREGGQRDARDGRKAAIAREERGFHS